MSLPSPVIVVPGITATYLLDEYSLPPETVWTVLGRKFERASLHPDDLRYEAIEPARVRPGQVFEVAYRELVEELRFNLRPKPDREVPVFWFGYDWRKPLTEIEDQLAEFIAEVIDRTRLLAHYHSAGGEPLKVSLVGHSMGGLVIAGYLARHGAEGRVDKVVTLASPFKGSFEAPIKITTGSAEWGTGPSSSRERKAARMTPSLYHLLPVFKNAVKDPDGNSVSLFQAKYWQPSVLKTLADFIKQYSPVRTNQEERDAQARELFSRFLSDAKAHRRRCERLDLSAAGLGSSDWLCIAGVDSTTRVELVLRPLKTGLAFDLRSRARENNWHVEEGIPRGCRTGDGTVPFEGAIPSFLPYESLVCVMPKDFGYWELKDRALAGLSGFHGVLPAMNMTHRLIVRHLTGKRDPHNNTWGCPPPDVAPKDWHPPVSGLEAKRLK